MSRKYGPRPERNRQDAHKTNEAIRAPQVRLIDENGNQVGVVPTRTALEQARDLGLDLVEITADANPPVCKIIDYGKFKFQMQKKASEAKKKQQITQVKELVFRPRTDDHDFDVKIKKAREFIERGDKVKINLRFRGREMAHQDIGMQMLDKIQEAMADVAKVDNRPKAEGRIMSMMLSPGATKSEK